MSEIRIVDSEVDRNIHVGGYTFIATQEQADQFKTIISGLPDSAWLSIAGTTMRITRATPISITMHVGVGLISNNTDIRLAEKEPFTVV